MYLYCSRNFIFLFFLHVFLTFKNNLCLFVICSPVISCPEITVPEGGSSDTKARMFNITVTFKCQPGFVMKGVPNVMCLATGQWSASPPVCKRKCMYWMFGK